MPVLPEAKAAAGIANDPRFGATTPDDPASPLSLLRGLVNWNYEEAPVGQTWTLKPGRSVMFTRSILLMPPADVQEGDLFNILINPLSPVSRVELSYTKGIDQQAMRRYLPGTALVLRWTLFPESTDPSTGDTIPAYYAFRTIQQTAPRTASWRGTYSALAYYSPGDLVSYDGALYMRLVEGSLENPFDPTKWVGGGGGTPGGTPRVLGDVPTQKALDVIAAYVANGGPVEETDPLYFGQEFIDDETDPGNEFEYRCRLRRVKTGSPVRKWAWGRFLEAGV